MGFFSFLSEKFAAAYGKSDNQQDQLKSFLDKIKFWIVVSIIFFVLYWILLLFQCSKPDGGAGVCLINENNGNLTTFTFNMKDLSTGGECGTTGEPYEITGQKIDWIDTGFVTNGKQLIIYANGNYFPWGEQQTPKTFGYHITNIKFDNGTTGEALNIMEDYKECEMNTDIRYSLRDNQDTKIMYENHFNSYTSLNANNRNENKGKKMIENDIQGDCIIGNNCKIGGTNEIQTACVLKHGAGIYMKIGADTPFSYHIKNYFVPEYKIDCSSGTCNYQYKTSNDGESYNLIQVPYAIPPVIYQKGANTSKFMWDIRDNVMKNLQALQDYKKETEYKFYTLVPDPTNEDCTGDDYQKINATCYHSEQKKILPSDMQNISCPQSSTENINLPNELCNPQSGKRIYIKPADTCYEDNTGEINLTFTSGVKAVSNKNISYRNNGLHITWIQEFISALFEPFFGSQRDDYKVGEVLEDRYPDKDKDSKTISVCRNGGNDEVLYFSTNGGDWIIKTEKYASQGLKIRDFQKVPTTETLEAMYGKYDKTIDKIVQNTKKKCVVFKIKNKYKSSKEISEYELEETASTTTTLVRFANLEDGLFVQIRNSIMSSSVYHIVRIMIVVWFVFSFGIGFINREKILSRVPTITSDWKRFLILLWCSDPNNYEFIDKYLWNALIYGSQSFAEGIINATSAVYGTSIVADEPMEFFDSVIASITSKETFYKLGSIGTSLWFIFFLFLFPFLANGIVNFALAVIGPIVSLGFTMFNFGSIIMFMPLYALVSMFGGKDKNKFTSAMKTLLVEFIHFAFSLGFFGFCIGFIYHYFLEVMDIKVCWHYKFSINFFYIFKLEWYDWIISDPGSDKELDQISKFKVIWNMIIASLEFSLVLSIFGKFSIIISEKLANIFAKGGGSFGINAANNIFLSFKEVFSSAVGKSHAATSEKNQPKQANQMDEKNKDDEEINREGVAQNESNNNKESNNEKNEIQRNDNNQAQDKNQNQNNERQNEQNENKDNKEGEEDVDEKEVEKLEENGNEDNQNVIQRQNLENRQEPKKIIEEHDEIEEIEEKNNIDNINKLRVHKAENRDDDNVQQAEENGNIDENLQPKIPRMNGLQEGQMQNNQKQTFREKLTQQIKEQHEKFIQQERKRQNLDNIKPQPQEVKEAGKKGIIVQQKQAQPVQRQIQGQNQQQHQPREKEINRGGLIQENDAWLQKNKAGIQENDNLFIQNNDAWLQDAIMGRQQQDDVKRQKIEEAIVKNEQQEKRLGKKINSLQKQNLELEKTIDKLEEAQKNTQEEYEAQKIEDKKTHTVKILDATKQIKNLEEQKFRSTKKNAWDLKKKQNDS